MSRNADSPQAIWQKKLQELSPIKPQYLAHPATFWWHNPLNPNSLRLAATAWTALKTCKHVPHWKFDLVKGLLPKSYLQLEKHFNSPYFIKNIKTIVVFDERDSMMLALHGNNLQQYLDNHDNFG